MIHLIPGKWFSMIIFVGFLPLFFVAAFFCVWERQWRRTSDFRCCFFSAAIAKIYSHWSIGSRKGRMNGQMPSTLDPAITQSVLMNSYSAANHEMLSLATRNGKIIAEDILSSQHVKFECLSQFSAKCCNYLKQNIYNVSETELLYIFSSHC